MSDLVNDALKASLQEDLKDLKSWEERESEDTYDYEEFLGLLKKRWSYINQRNLIFFLKQFANF